MDKTILITDKDTPLGNAAVREALNRGYKVLTTVQGIEEPNEEGADPASTPLKLKEVTWNRRSPVSAKTLVLESRRFLGQLTDVLLIYSVDKTRQAFHSMTMEDVEERIDRKIKGSIFFVRELLRHFQNEEKGTLAFALDQSYSDEHSPLDSAATGSFHAFADSVLRFYQKDQFYFTGFLSVSSDTDDYARFILDQMEAKPSKASGEWLRHSQKTVGLFNNLPLVKRTK